MGHPGIHATWAHIAHASAWSTACRCAHAGRKRARAGTCGWHPHRWPASKGGDRKHSARTRARWCGLEPAWRSNGRAARAPAVHTVRAARPPVAVVPEAALPLRRAAVAGGQARHDLRKQLLLQRRAAGHDRVRECILGRLRDSAPAASIKGASAALAGAQCRAGCRLAPAKGPARCSRARVRACRHYDRRVTSVGRG